jgi:hypothetical protein
MALAGALSAELGGAAKRRIDPRLPPRPGGAEVRNHVGIELQSVSRLRVAAKCVKRKSI